MRIYLVRWPNLSASLVAAISEQHLLDVLDEIANPSGCTWTRYSGPLFLDFDLVARATLTRRKYKGAPHSAQVELPPDPSMLQLRGVSKLASRELPMMNVSASGDTGRDMIEAVSRYACPETAKAYWDGPTEINEGELEQALRADAMRLVESARDYAKLRDSEDPDAQLALSMDASVRWCRDLREARLGPLERTDDGEPEPTLEDEIETMLERALDEWGTTYTPRDLRRSLLYILQLVETLESQQPAPDSSLPST